MNNIVNPPLLLLEEEEKVHDAPTVDFRMKKQVKTVKEYSRLAAEGQGMSKRKEKQKGTESGVETTSWTPPYLVGWRSIGCPCKKSR